MLKELIFSISLVKAQKGLVSLSAGKVIDQDKPQLTIMPVAGTTKDENIVYFHIKG